MSRGRDGAEDAWYQTSLEFEVAALNNQCLTGGAADIFKCFDQIERKLLEELLIQSGCPHRIREPYIRYLENLDIFNSLAGTLGEPHKRKCSIPQGCPLSMTIDDHDRLSHETLDQHDERS